jgi:Flp pilus assembly pilin Flp
MTAPLSLRTIRQPAREDGQTMAEYGVILGVLVLGVVAGLSAFALAFTGKLDYVATAIGSI